MIFITTVRTQHVLEAPHVQDSGVTCTDEDLSSFCDFGFLSDAKLLNTALTRTQSAVIVVGDPVALCAIGECSKVWQTYLKHCQNMRSLFPQNHTLESIRQQVQSLASSPAREKLLYIASDRQSAAQGRAGREFKPAQTSQAQGYNTAIRRQQNPQETMAAVAAAGSSQAAAVTKSNGIQAGIQNMSLGAGTPPRSPLAPLNPLKVGLQRPLGPAAFNLGKAGKTESFYEIGEEFSLDADEVLAQVKNLENTPGRIAAAFSNSFSVKEEKGYAVVCDSATQKMGTQSYFNAYTGQQLRSLLADTARYFRGVLCVDEGECYVKSLPDRIKVPVPSRLYCEGGNNKDEVVAEIVDDEGQRFAKVIGVLNRANDLKKMYIVCTMGNMGGVMVPVDKGLGPMLFVTTQSHLSQNVSGSVTVYKFTRTKQVRFSHLEQMSQTDVESKYFVVRYLKHDSRVILPLCVVVGVIQADNSASFCTKVLDLQHQMVKTYNPDIAAEIDDLYPDNFALTPQLLATRHLDLRDRWCFTVDTTGHNCNSRAFSIDQKTDESYEVGVHITDVAMFMRKNSSVDLEARARGAAVHPVQANHVPLLPARLAQHLCNLKPNEDRLALSVLMTVKSTGELTEVNVQKTVINCKKTFTLREAEEVIHDPQAYEDYMKSCLLVLSQISSVWRRDRLGNAALYDEKTYNRAMPFSQQLVEELVIMTQHHVAVLVSSAYPDVTPLLVQDAPHPQSLEVWKKQHAADAINSVALTKPFLNPTEQETCKCGLACTHIVNHVRQNNVVRREHIDVVSVLWDGLNEAVSMGDYSKMLNIIVAAENHPQIAMAMSKLTTIQEDSMFICSSSQPSNQWFHYTLNHSPYTSCTDTLNSYVDIVVQRMLLACLEGQSCPYSRQEIETICTEATAALKKKESYEMESFVLRLSLALLTHPLILQPVVTEVSQQLAKVCFPGLECLRSRGELKLSTLGISDVPLQTPQGDILLKWKVRVYDYTVLQHQTPVGSNNGELNPDRFIFKIPAFQWQRLLIAIRESDEEQRKHKLTTAVEVVGKQVCNPALEGSYIDDVSSEGQKLGRFKYSSDFSMRLHVNQVLLVQLSARLNNGMLAPYIQLLSLTNSLDICLQHREHPVESFLPITDVPTADVPCTDITTYKTKWRSLTESEAITRAVASNDHFVINNVVLDWKTGRSTNTSAVAELTLPISFMKERNIKLDSRFQENLLFNNSVFCKAYFSDYVCVRYSSISLPDMVDLPDTLAQVINNGCTGTWVGHCAVTDVSRGNDKVTLKLELRQSDVPLPIQLIRRRTCSVEFIMRTVKDR